MTTTIGRLRRYAIARTLFAPGTLPAALTRLGFVQADPIRSPARAQDLVLRHRVANYRAGDLERLYATLGVEEDFFVNYGFVTRAAHALMHPRGKFGAWPAPGKRTGEAVLAFVRDRGEVHPRDVDAHFARGAVRNYWGGSSTATTHVLDHLHYRGLLRVTGRAAGIRRYAPRDVPAPPLDGAARRARQDALVDLAVRVYAPVPSATLSWLVLRMRYAAPQWRPEIRAMLARAKARLNRARVDDVDWFWPADEALDGVADTEGDSARLLAPFDPVVWDRRRFEHFWGWTYRFEAYTPAARRTRGYYALPLLWRERMIGWGNLSVAGGCLQTDLGFVSGRAPRDRAFARGLAAELARVQTFLGIGG
ncbi:MAG: crosslink repair DNA glycosylase YcaQ family protein [Acidobacteriota bacterium]